MSSADLSLLIALVALLLLAVFLAAAEASLLRVNEVRARALAGSGDRQAERLMHIVEHLPQFLNLILLLALLAQIGAATITGILAQRWFGNLGVTIGSIVLTVVLYIYGEAIPKTYAVRHSERTATFVATPITILERLLRPVVKLLVWIADLQMPGKGVTTSATVTEDELRLLAVEAAGEGEITESDQLLIDRAFRFGDRSVDDIMVPRPDVVAIDRSQSVEQALTLALEAGHRRLPVFSETIEHLDGVARLRDLIAARESGTVGLEDVVRQPLVVPESMSVTALLAEMQTHRNHLAVVVDEYGITVGIVTVEDVAEELLGSITDEPTGPDVRKLAANRWRVVGSIPVEDLEILGMELPEGDWNTAAGLMLGVAGKLLQEGDSVDVSGYTMTARSVRGRRITIIDIEGPSA